MFFNEDMRLTCDSIKVVIVELSCFFFFFKCVIMGLTCDAIQVLVEELNCALLWSDGMV